MPSAATRMDLEGLILNEVKSDSERQTPHDTIYMWNLKRGYKWTYLQNQNRVTDVEHKLWLQGGKGGEQ